METAKYMNHLPSCNVMQDWSEAELAISDTPEQFRDYDWQIAREELNIKMNTCTCGLAEAKETLTQLEKENGKTT